MLRKEAPPAVAGRRFGDFEESGDKVFGANGAVAFGLER